MTEHATKAAQPMPQRRLALFALGQCVSTPESLALLGREGIIALIARHVMGDYGDLDEDDKQANVDALADGGRVLSAYQIGRHKYYVITEADRNATTVMLADEY